MRATRDFFIYTGSNSRARTRAGALYYDSLAQRRPLMLTRDDNQILTRVGPGTPMGDLMRHYWQPVMLSS